MKLFSREKNSKEFKVKTKREMIISKKKIFPKLKKKLRDSQMSSLQN